MRRVVIDWLLAAIVTILVGASIHLDSQAGLDIRESLLAKSFRGWTNDDRTSYRLCAEIGGPNVGFYYKDNGQLVCTNKRGYKLSTQP